MKRKNLFLGLLFGLIISTNTLYSVEFKTTVVKPVDNLGNVYFTNEIAGFTAYNPSDKVSGEIGTYSKAYSVTAPKLVTSSEIFAKDVLQDKEKDTIRYKLIGLKGTGDAASLTENCNFEPCAFKDITISKDSKLSYLYSRQYRLKVESSSASEGTKEISRVIVTHNNLQNSLINAAKDSLKISFKFQNSKFAKEEIFFNIASINADYKKHLLLYTDIDDNNNSQIKLIGFTDKDHHHDIATWSLTASQLSKFKDGTLSEMTLDVGKGTLLLNDVALTITPNTTNNFTSIATNVVGEIFVQRKPSDLRKILFPKGMNIYSGKMKGFSIFGIKTGGTARFPINVSKEGLNISFDVQARTWQKNDRFFTISREGESSDSFLGLYIYSTKYLQLSHSIPKGEYVSNLTYYIPNNTTSHIEMRIFKTIKTKTIDKDKNTSTSTNEVMYYSSDSDRRDRVSQGISQCLGYTGASNYTKEDMGGVISERYTSGTRRVKFYPTSGISKKDYDNYNTCLAKLKNYSSQTNWDEYTPMTINVTSKIKVQVNYTDSEATIQMKKTGGSWKDMTKESRIYKFFKNSSVIKGDLVLPNIDYIKNFKINGKLYSNTAQTLYTKEEPTELKGSGEYWINEGDGVEILSSVKGSEGLTTQSSTFTEPNGSPKGNVLATTILDGEEYYSTILTENMRASNAGTVKWQYGAKIYEFKATIGTPFTLDKATLYDGPKGSDSRLKTREEVDASFLNALTTMKPTSVVPIAGTVPTGTAVTNAYVFSPLNPNTDEAENGRDLYKGQLYFTRPGKYRLSWSLDATKFPIDNTGIQQLVIEVTVGWPAKADYYQVAETNPVVLDARKKDRVFFKELRLSQKFKIENGKYKSITGPVNEIKIDDKQAFSFNTWTDLNKDRVYRSVLYYTQATGNKTVATGDLNTEKVLIKVVESRHWSNKSGVYPLTEANATIGEEITDANSSTLTKHTGCILKSKELKNARYNASTYNPSTLQGAIFAVNQEPQSKTSATDGKNDLVVAWYDDDVFMRLEWPNRAVRYSPKWPDTNTTKRIVVASRLGSDGLDKANGVRQFVFSSSKYKNFKLYNQADANKTGYNPNEEHALLAPSFFYNTKNPRPQAVFALRNDLNRVNNSDANYTSEPFVLIQYQENNSSAYKMALYNVVMSDENTTDTHNSYKVDTNSDGKIDTKDGNGSFRYVFNYPMYVGDKVVAPYPLNTVIGANTIKEISGSNDNTNVNPYWEDKDGNSWVVTKGSFSSRFWYPMLPSFWHPKAKTGQIIPWSDKSNDFVSDGKTYVKFSDTLNIQYDSYYKIGIPELRLGETLTFAGGEEKKDDPKAKGLPSAVAWASAEVISDSRNAEQNAKKYKTDYSVKIRPVVRELKVELASTDFPKLLEPATKLTKNIGGKWFFEELHAGLKQRVYYDQASGKVVLRGILNGRFAGDKLLTSSPGGYNYILQPNVLTIDDLLTLRNLTNADDKLKKAFTELYALSLDPTLSKDDLSKVHFDSDKKIVFVKKLPLKEAKKTALKPTRELNFTEKFYYADADDALYEKAKTKAVSSMKNRFPNIVINNIQSDMSDFFAVLESTTLKPLKERLIFDKDNQTLTLKLKVITAKFNTYGTVQPLYLSSAQRNYIVDKGQNIPELLELVAKVYNPKFNDFDNLSVKDGNTSLLVTKQFPVLGKAKEDRAVEYVVGLTRFLRDNHNRYLVAKDLNSSDINVSLPNGEFPAGLKADDLELVTKSELPYGVTIEDTTTLIALGKGGKLVRIKEGHGYIPSSSLGVGLAVMTNADLLKDSKFKSSHIVIAENNDPAIKGAPIQLHIFKVNNRPYRGQIKTVLSDNAFDEKITLRHTGDFGGNVKDLVFEWFYRETDNVETPPYLYKDPSCSQEVTPTGNAGKNWKPFADDRVLPNGYVQGQGRYELVFGKKAGKDVLVDNSFYVRYREKNSTSWSGWAGSGGNNPCNKPAPVFKSQLVKGWVKRVTDKINVYDARISNFSGDAPATYVSMIEQIGFPYVGDVALNDDKNVVENTGLASLYETVLNRAKNLSIDAAQPVSTDGVIQALQNASSRISKFYMLLGNEAYSDALDPTIGYSTNERTYGELAPTIFSFQNQLSSLNEEEMVLLRGKAGSKEGDTGGAPVYNRLLWNFTNGAGEAAYALSYNIKDKNKDGFINEKDAKIMYPQGHGDAWGHYLTATRVYYDLLRHHEFNWVSRAEKYEIDGITLDVDYLDERNFIQAAAYKSKVGSEVLNLTYKDLYVEDPAGQWQGYKDTKSYRTWGVNGWGKRAHIGAYCDWVVGNALLPSVDSNHTGIQKIDRETVGELQDIAVNGNAILTKLSEIDSGLNPLGLLPDVVPFDIEPGSDKSHFEQVYSRAEDTLKGAKNVFDYANSLKQRIRQVADSQEQFKEQVDNQDREYRNRLVELFGTPYEGVIGAGKAFPEGYDGPDVNFYQYIDVADLSEKNLPKQDKKLTVYLKTLNNKSYSKKNDKNQTKTLFHKYFPGDFPQGFTGDLGVPGTDNLTYPLTKGRYAFNAPKYWGQRKYPGAIQSALIDIVKADVDLHLANKAYTGLIDDVKRIQRDIKSRVDLKNSQIKMNGELVSNIIYKNTAVTGMEAVLAAGDAIKGNIDDVAQAAKEAAPKSAGTSTDVTSALRGAILGTASASNAAITTVQIPIHGLIKAAETAKEVADQKVELTGIEAEAKYDIKQYLSELDALFDSEPELRLATFKAREIVRQATNKYRTVLGKSLRLLEERIAFNKKTASKTQGKRYQDMAFRLNRNAAAQKYKASFNMAAKYAYLAAKAYDYETNLSPKAAASAQHILRDIVQASTLGSFKEGAAIGQGGLADILARLKANFAVLKTQMGFNNPQTELAPFSLRSELFRIKSDSNLTWEKRLSKAYVPDIWKIPEFRTHMRPFAAESKGVQPGIVIQFSTTVESGKNFFGNKLSAGDHAYDASQFSTRIKSVGIWLDGYKELGLAQTSRAYLVPVGQDIMYVPDSNDLDTREWNVKDQKIPVPLPFGKKDMENKSWTPTSSLDGAEGKVRRHSRLRVYNDSGEVDQSKMQSDSRLFGRSVWNTRWLLVIPGESLLNPSQEGIQRFIHGKKIPGSTNKRDGHGVSDIKLIFSTYSYSGN